jgi:hypothetical protein
LDALFGRTKLVRSKLEDLFALPTAYISLKAKLGIQSSGKAGLCFKPVTSSSFSGAEQEVRDLLYLSAKETQTKVKVERDEYGFRWVVLEDPDLEDLVAIIHMASQTLREQGFGEQLLAAVFAFQDQEGRPIYWIYSYKRGKFYPFVPSGQGRDRDNATELHLRSVMERELPIEGDLEKWYPLWGIPL